MDVDKTQLGDDQYRDAVIARFREQAIEVRDLRAAIDDARELCALTGTYSDAEALASEILEVLGRNPS